MVADPVVAFLEAMLERHGLDPALHRMPMGSIVPVDDRKGEGTASAYVLGEYMAIFCDPDVADRVRPFEPGMGSTQEILDRFAAFGVERGAELSGAGVMRVLTQPLADAEIDGTDRLIALDRDTPADVARIAALIEASDDDDVDEADLDLTELDPVIWATEVDPGGTLSAWAGAYPWDDVGGMWDIGVLTHPQHRRRGLGQRVVQRLIADLVAKGEVPLYRHSTDNAASAALAGSLGFAVATQLTAIRFP